MLREQSHQRRIPPCPRPFFNFTCFYIFCTFLGQKKMTALKWPRPVRFHIRNAILARRHSRFSHVFGQISDGKPSILLFFAKKCDGAKLAPSRGWRFRDVILTRRREQQIPPCARSFSIFDKKNVVAGTSKSQSYTYITARMLGPGAVPKRGIAGS